LLGTEQKSTGRFSSPTATFTAVETVRNLQATDVNAAFRRPEVLLRSLPAISVASGCRVRSARRWCKLKMR
jgi:hypothetical protein